MDNGMSTLLKVGIDRDVDYFTTAPPGDSNQIDSVGAGCSGKGAADCKIMSLVYHAPGSVELSEDV